MVYGVLGTTGRGTISRHIYGHFAEHLGRCIYEGLWVGEDSAIPNTEGYRIDVLEALRNLHIPVLRWPGGCFADEYHWKDGVGPRATRPSMINTHWGGVTETNAFGTHEFLRLCELLGAEPYVCGNVGSGTVQEMAQWIEYMTCPGQSPMADLRREHGRAEPFPLRYFGVGNENWGCGGGMTPEYYANEYRRYQMYCRDYGQEPLFKIACGPNDDNYHWTEVMMREAMKIDPFGRLRWMHGLSLHYYTTIRDSSLRAKPAVGFTVDEYYETLAVTLKMETLLRMHGAIMDRYDPDRRVALIVDEWGCWHATEQGTNPGFLYQQNTMRDAIVAAINLNLFNRHCERVRMANIAQLVNVLQAVVLTDGPRMLRTPTYHVFDMFSGHQDAELLDLHIDQTEFIGGDHTLPSVSCSASRGADGTVLITMANLNHEAAQQVRLLSPSTGEVMSANHITAGVLDAHNTFDNPDAVAVAEMPDVRKNGDILEITLAPMSVAAVLVASSP